MHQLERLVGAAKVSGLHRHVVAQVGGEVATERVIAVPGRPYVERGAFGWSADCYDIRRVWAGQDSGKVVALGSLCSGAG